jgi:hypothetical protein
MIFPYSNVWNVTETLFKGVADRWAFLLAIFATSRSGLESKKKHGIFSF